jgi:hypothetical protein
MTTTPTTPKLSSNIALEYAVNNNIIKLAKWALMQPAKSDNTTTSLLITKADNIKECLALAMAKETNKDIVDLLVSELEIPKTIEESKIENPKIEGSNIENPKIENPKIENSKVETNESNSENPNVETKGSEFEKLNVYVDIILNGIPIKGSVVSVLMWDIATNPSLALTRLRSNQYSLKSLNYQLEKSSEKSPYDITGYTILHMLCSNGRNTNSTYDDIMEHLLTKTDIDINIRNGINHNNHTAFMVAAFYSGNRISDKVFRLFLDHPKFQHDYINNSMNLIETMLMFNNYHAVYLLLEHSKTFYGKYTKEHYMAIMFERILNVKGNTQEVIYEFGNIMNSEKITFATYDWFFNGFCKTITPVEIYSRYFEIMARSKKMKLDVSGVLDKLNIADTTKILILKIYIKYYRDGLY